MKIKNKQFDGCCEFGFEIFKDSKVDCFLCQKKCGEKEIKDNECEIYQSLLKLSVMLNDPNFELPDDFKAEEENENTSF